MKKKMQNRKQFVAIILLIVFGGSMVLSAAVTLYVTFFNKEKPVMAQNEQTQIVSTTSIPSSTNTVTSTNQTSTQDDAAQNKDASVQNTPQTTAPENKQAVATEGSASTESKPTENVKTTDIITPLIKPTVTYSVSGQNILVKANVNSPDDTVFSVVVVSTDMSISKKAIGTVKNGVANFTIEMPDKTQRSMMGSFQLSMTENKQPSAAVQLYGAKGEKIQADDKNGGRIVKSSDSSGVSTIKYDYMFTIKYQ